MEDDTADSALSVEDRTIGQRLRSIRDTRRKSLRVIAGLAGISASHLSRLESGERALDRLSLIVALANALQVAPSELVALPVPAPANGNTDATIQAVRLALDAIDIDRPGGLVLPVEVLKDRVVEIHQQSRACKGTEVGNALPGLIRDLHTTLVTGRDHGELLGLAVHLHVHITRMWLGTAGASADLRRRTVFLARRLAQESDELSTLGVAAFGVADVLAGDGAFDLAEAELDGTTLPATTADTAGLLSAVAVTRALLGVVTGQGDTTAPMDAAADIANQWGELGEADPLGFGFGPTNVGFRRVHLALEAGEPDLAVSIAEGLQPEQNPFMASRAYYWVGYGRALARLRKRHDHAVMVFRRAEAIQAHRIHRDPMVREVLAELVLRSQRDAVGRELRGMAYRAGLPV